MQIEGLIHFKPSTDQAIVSLYFMRIFISFSSLSFVKFAAIIIGLDFSTLKKAYFKCLGNYFKINPSELVSTSYAFPSQPLDFSALPLFRLSTVS